MSNIFKDFVQSVPVKTPLEFGHNTNIVIESIDFNDRKRNGITVKANTFIKLTKIDPETKKPSANTEISFWNLDPEKDFAKDNFLSQFSILAGIIAALGGDIETFEQEVMTAINNNTDDAALAKFLKNANNIKSLQTVLSESFKKQVDGKIGLDSKLLKCKMVSNKSGFLEAADDISWILPIDSEQELPPVTSREQAVRKKAIEEGSKKVEPDKTGKAPEETSTTSAEPAKEAKVAARSSLDSI